MRRVTVSYEAVPGSGDWERIQPNVERHLPLTNLHWKSGSRSIRTIQSLALDLQPFSTFKEDAAAPVRLLERPYLHLLFVVCDDNEVYRATVRLQIRYWLDKVVAMQNQEWLIINVTTGRAVGGKFYQRKGSVVDKIRADFNTGKKDRCVQVSQSSPAEDPTAWAEFTKRVKEGIIARFDTNITLYEEDVRRADSQRQLPGWNFCTFFTQKEALADCFEAMNLIEDALIQYDELEASFFATLKDNNMAWFGKIGGLEPGDDALEILSTSNKHYRELIDSNSISVFDFRIYLFARQAALLLALNRIPEVARRGSYFISSFARTLRQNQKTLGRNFLESWTFSACLHVVDECQHAAKVAALDPATLASFTAVKAELLELARKQLDKIGIEAGHLPLAHPFSMSLQEISSDTPPATAATSPDMRPPVTREDLLEAMVDRDLFDKLYISLTNRSIKAYQTSRRKRCALKMHASLAALEDHRERFTQAQKLYSHLPAHYVDLRWSKVESSLLAKCTRLQETLGMSKERLLSTLALVRAGIEYGSKVWSLDTLREAGSSMSKEEGNRVLAQRLMDQVYELSGLLLKDFAAIAFPTFSMRLASGRGTTAADEDGVNVSLIIKSLLPCTIKVDEVRLKFSTVDGEQIWFTAGGCLLPPGDTEVVLFCPIAVTGQLALELSQVRYSRIIFQYSHRPISPQNLAPDPRFTPHTPSQPIVVFLRDRQALDIYLEVPRAIRLDQDRMAIISIATGRNQVVKVTVRLTIANAEATFFLEAAQIVLGNAGLVADVVEGALIVENVQADSTVKIQLPIQGLLQDTAIDVNIVAEYFTAKRPTTRRTLRRATHYPVALPLAVTVQDFFREDCLLSKFSVTTDGFHALRIRSAILEGDANVVVKACRNPNAPDVTILPLQTANFLFKIQRPSPVTLQTEQPPLQLTLKYRPIQEEFLTLVKSAISSACSSASLEESNQWFLDNLLPAIEAATNLHWFGVSGSLEHLVCDGLVWRGKTSAAFEGETGGVVFACIERVYEALRKVSTEDLPDEWRLLTIPVELPSLWILNVVHVSALGRVEVGTPISAVIKIVPSLSWAQRAPSGPPVALLYEVATVADDWLISGRTSGQFLAEDGVETSIPLTLIALRPGSLFLPSVAVRPLDAAELSCETQNRSAATCVSILPVVASETFSIELDMLEGIRV